ncbi:transcriptional repressor XBP1 [Favolaschia claudopus]|uniref:Transcriptional repressor XBP1 n=1 Tax=Favolaschia claudopus TaxID=2862362 RepID=A0AAW0AXQ0_9AGAR
MQTLQPSSSQTPRFRPYASSVHHVTKGRYITSNDPRGYIPVYEYPLNNQWIMMDIDDGYILWTGIWKALGNSKADIVKMVDSQPELAQVIRRVRGGYLKIQGTWMPYETALKLARRVAWNIRDDLIPLFGPEFPNTCLSPDQPGYGQVVASTGRRRARRVPQAPLMPTPPVHTQHAPPSHQPSMFAPTLPHSPHLYSSSSSNIRPIDIPKPKERAGHTRYSPYHSAVPLPRKLSTSSSGSLSLDIPALSLREKDAHSRTRTPPTRPAERIQLPAIQQFVKSETHSQYALPPISALEDLRGVDTQDSAAVLRRLQSDSDDDLYSDPYSYSMGEVQRPGRGRRSLSAPATKKPGFPSMLPRRSLGQIPSPHRRMDHPRLSVSVPSDISRDSDSTCDPSPISPATPRSAVLGSKDQLALVPLSVLKEQQSRTAAYSFPVTFHNDWMSDSRDSPRSDTDQDPRISACRYSCTTQDHPSSGDVLPVHLSSW